MQRTFFWKRGIFFSVLTAFVMMAGPLVAAEGDDDPVIRPYANGAGPAAIFRFGRQEDRKRDVFAIVDPVLWRIQFFTLDDPSAEELPLKKRFTKRGDCMLPPTFRVWRVHQHENRVVLQSQPTVTRKALIFKKGEKPDALKFHALSIPATAADIDQAVSRAATPNDMKPDIPCSENMDVEKLPLFGEADAALTVTGGGKAVFHVSRKKPPATLGDFGRARIRLAIQGRYLVSAQELEHGRQQGAPLRHFLVTTRTPVPGFVATEVVLERRSTVPALNQRMRINLGLSKVKMGHRNVAISSTGEVLVMGSFDKAQFRVRACRFGPHTDATRCSVTDDIIDPALDGAADQNETAQKNEPLQATPPLAALLWLQAFNYSEQLYTVDIGKPDDDCIRFRGDKDTASCKFAGAFPWTPLSDLRLAKGSVMRKGVPYAQRENDDSVRPNFTSKDKPVLPPIRKPLFDDGASPPFVFGDIENSGNTLDGEIKVFGIDCSAFLSKLWGFGDAISTKSFRNRANNDQDSQITRIGAIDQAHIGDAFVIRIEDAGGKALLNHIVLYQDDGRSSGPTDSSHAILVVESSSSCGGVCWSLYDESFFHGWGIIRHEKHDAPPKDMKRIPESVEEWRNRFAKP
jgi:hypothetical protein